MYGGFPDGGVLKPAQYPSWQRNYLQILTSRDLPNWGLPSKPRMTMRLLKMLAAVHAQTLNASQLGKSLDISYKTVQSYLDYLEGAFLIRQLTPFHKNLKKRVVKSPKIFWRDSGLLHALLNIDSEKQLFNQPWVGAGWEGFVIEQILGTLDLSPESCTPYFLRTSDGYEIDLVLEFGREIWAIEIKLTASPGLSDIKRLNKAADMIGARRRILVSRTSRTIENGDTVSSNIDYLLKSLL
jgi:predicted AAA+ superfamily ATPase